MGLLSEIQQSLLQGDPLGPVLLKFRFLVARLGSAELEDWVRFETDGYPKDVAVPEYRKFPVSYTGNFNGSYGRMVSDFPILPYLIAQHAGEDWLTHHERQSVSAIEELANRAGAQNKNPEIEAANLVILLSDKVLSGMYCHGVHGIVSSALMVQMISTVRTRILDLTLGFERKLPESMKIVAGSSPIEKSPEREMVVNNITHQVFHGPVGSNIGSAGEVGNINSTVTLGNAAELEEYLVQGGILRGDAQELCEIAAAEKPLNDKSPFGPKAMKWIENNITKAMSGVWKVTSPVAMALLTTALEKFYGLK